MRSFKVRKSIDQIFDRLIHRAVEFYNNGKIDFDSLFAVVRLALISSVIEEKAARDRKAQKAAACAKERS